MHPAQVTPVAFVLQAQWNTSSITLSSGSVSFPGVSSGSGFMLNEENELNQCIEKTASSGKLWADGQAALLSSEARSQLPPMLRTGPCGGEIPGSELHRYGTNGQVTSVSSPVNGCIKTSPNSQCWCEKSTS